MTKGSVAKCLTAFMFPILIGNLLQQLYNTADSIIVGNFASQAFSLAAVGTCAPAATLFVFWSTGFSGGGSVVIAQYFGAKKTEEMKRSISTLLLFTLYSGIIMTAVGVLVARWFLRVVLAVTGEILPMATSYLRIYCAGLIFTFMYNGIAAVLRALGNSRSSLLFLSVSAISNILLDLLFVIAFDWGVAGAAFATVIAQALSAVVSFVYMAKKYGEWLPGRKEWVMDREILRVVVKMGMPAALQSVAVNISSILLQRIVNSFGPVNMEAFQCGTRMDNFLLAPANAFGLAVTTFAAQNIGAGNIERAKKGMTMTALLSLAVSLPLIILITAFAPQLARLFGVSEEGVRLAVQQIRFVVPCMVIFATEIPGNGWIRGAGAARMAAMCTLVTMIVRMFCSEASFSKHLRGHPGRPRLLDLPAGGLGGGLRAGLGLLLLRQVEGQGHRGRSQSLSFTKSRCSSAALFYSCIPLR